MTCVGLNYLIMSIQAVMSYCLNPVLDDSWVVNITAYVQLADSKLIPGGYLFTAVLWDTGINTTLKIQKISANVLSTQLQVPKKVRLLVERIQIIVSKGSGHSSDSTTFLTRICCLHKELHTPFLTYSNRNVAAMQRM